MRRWKKIVSFNLLLVVIAAVLSCLAPVPAANAANPTTISFQGKVVNANGTNVTDGTYSFVFKLYTVASTGTAIWTETDSVVVTSGVFQVNLGNSSGCLFFTSNACNNSTPIDFSTVNSLYLGITFNSDPAGEMSPRVQLQSVPYAYYADNAGSLGGRAASGYVQLTPSTQQSGTINVNGNITSGATIQGTTLIAGALNTAVAGGTLTTNLGTLQRTAAGTTTIDLKDTANTLLQLLNSGTGVANFNLSNGDLQTGTTPTTRLTNAGALSNITGYSQTSGAFLQSGTGNFTTGSGAVTLSGATSASSTLGITGLTSANGGLAVTEAAASTMTVTASGVARTADIATIGNAVGQEPTVDGINALQLTWFAKPATGNMSSAQRVNITNNNTATAGQVQGFRIVATGAGGAVNSDTDAIYIDALANSSTGTNNENAIEIGSNWDNVISSPKLVVSGGGDIRGAGFDYFDPSKLTSGTTTLVGTGGATGGNFGGAFSSGAFLQTTDTYDQEFVGSLGSATTNNRQVGDDGAWWFNNNGNISVTSSAVSTTGGFFRITTGTTTTRGALLAYGVTAGTQDKSLNASNLPIIQEKVRPSILRVTDDFFWGAMDTATPPTANDTLPANGMFFETNNSTGTTGWTGMVRRASTTVGTVTCPGTIGAGDFATGRIVVVNGTTVRFFIDIDASDGVTMVDCGAVTGTLPTADLGLEMYVIHTVNTSSTFDMDYARWWQDDAPVANTAAAADATNALVTQADDSSSDSVADDSITVDGSDPDSEGLMNQVLADTAQPDEPANVSSLLADHIAANVDVTTPKLVSDTIETNNIVVGKNGINFTNSDGAVVASIDSSGKLHSSDGSVSVDQPAASSGGQSTASASQPTTQSGVANSAPPTDSTRQALVRSDGSFQFNDGQGQQLVRFDTDGNASFKGNLDLASARAHGNLTVDGDLNVAGLSTFQKLATFLAKTVFRQDVEFDGHIAVSKDSAGYATLRKDESTVHVKFKADYASPPVVSASFTDGHFGGVTVNNVDEHGFDITLQDPAQEDSKLSWTAVGVIDPQTATNPAP